MKTQQQKKEATTTNVKYTASNFHVKSRGQNCDNTFFYKRLPINDTRKFDNMLSNENFKKTIKMYDFG